MPGMRVGAVLALCKLNMLAKPSPLVREVIGCAIEVHRVLGPGLLESIYETCLAHEFTSTQIRFRRQVVVPVVYKDLQLEGQYRIDFVVEDTLLIELKSVEHVLPVHKAQVLSYMRLANLYQGLLMNFNEPTLVNGLTNFLLTPR
jgi:GxxExxY protein